MKIFSLIQLILLFISLQSSAQNSATEIYFGQSQSDLFSLCSGHLYSNNGPAPGYPSNYNATIALDGNTNEDAVVLTFEMVQLGATDYIYVYDALNSSLANESNLLATIHGTPALPISIRPKSINGRLLVRFKTDNLSNASEIGFKASVSCTTRVQAVDLTVSLYTTFPDKPYGNGATFNTSVQVNNSGNIASPPTHVRLLLSTDQAVSNEDIFLGTADIPLLNKNSSATGVRFPVKIPATLIPGYYYLLYEVDYKGDVAEIEETNNVLSQRILINAPTYDLTFSGNLRTVPTAKNLPVGLPAQAYFQVTNNGNSNAKGVNVIAYLSDNPNLNSTDIPLFSLSLDSLAAYDQKYLTGDFTIPAGTVPGNYYLILSGTLKNVPETNKGDNEMVLPITVLKPYHDFLISRLYDQKSITRGTSLFQKGNIYNKGNATAYNVGITYLLSKDTIADVSDRVLKKITVDSVRAESEAYFFKDADSIQVENTLETGNYFLLGLADYENKFPELVETNNAKFYPVVVTDTLYFPIQPNYTYGSFGSTFLKCSGNVYYDGQLVHTAPLMAAVTIQSGELTKKVQLLFETFDFKTSDSLWISDGFKNYLFTKNNPPLQAIVSTGQFLNVKLKLDFDHTNFGQKTNGFNAHITCLDGSTTDIARGKYNISPLKIYPNPAEDLVIFDTQEISLGMAEYSIVNLLGQIFFAGKHDFRNVLSVDIAAVKKGVYFFRVCGAEGKIYAAELLIK